MKVALNNFRAFADTPDVEIRPLTILVGENSSGKTSFLAALRFALEMAKTEATSFFNVYPFDLGPYEDIVHSGIQPSTTKRFSIAVEKFVNVAEQRTFHFGKDPDDRPTLVRATFFFKSNYGDTILSSIRLQNDGDQMDLHLTGNTKKLTITLNDETFSLGQDQLSFGPDDPKGVMSLRSVIYMLFSFRYENPSVKENPRRIQAIERFSGIYDAFISNSYDVISEPPVRSVPRKVYTSSDDAGEPLGNAPLRLSKLKRSNKRLWTQMNKDLNRYGRQSGLFSRVDIKKLTQQDSGPFQVKVTVRAQSSAIADVGYGVSQSLPILTDIIDNKGSKAALLLQQPEVHLHPRAQAELGSIFSEFVTKNSRGLVIAETHSDYLIDRVRIEVLEGRLNPSLVNIVFLEPADWNVKIHQIGVDRAGNIVGAPPCYRSFFIREQERILGF